MKILRLNVLEDSHTISRRHSPSNTEENGRENSFPIPDDLMMEIYSRLPAKSVARCRCLSKHFSIRLSFPDFTDFFLTRSSTRPQLLFACPKDSHVFFFSSPQLQNPDESSLSPPVAASFHMKIRCTVSDERFSLVKGLIHRRDERFMQNQRNDSVIYNPTTKQSFTLPRMMTELSVGAKSYLGYDQIKKQYKLLSMTWPSARNFTKHRVLTLGTLKPSWRLIECCIPHCPPMYDNEICINGVLYYLVSVHSSSINISYMIACFDFTTEKFRFMNVMESFSRAVDATATLINYNGKLGSLRSDEDSSFVCGTSKSIELWILEDPEKNEWSKHVHVLPPLWKNVVSGSTLYFVGAIGTNEIVLASFSKSNPFYVYYYNIEKKTIVRIEIQGIDAFKSGSVYTYLDHVENVEAFASMTCFRSKN